MQLVCNGVRLDMPEGASLSFKKSNPLFAFDNMACERTLSFNIPATPNNEKVFGLAKKPEFSGAGMRTKFTCQLQAGSVVLDGVLHVESYDGNYKGVFVTGDLIGLRAIKEAGKLSEWMTESDVYLLSVTPATPAIGRQYKWYQIDYAHGTEFARASMRVATIIEDACTQLGIAHPTMPSGADYIRIVPEKMLSLHPATETLKRVFVSAPGTSDYVDVNNVDVADRYLFFDSSSAHAFRTITTADSQGVESTTVYYSNIAQFVPKSDVTLTFPNDFSSQIFVVKFPGTTPLNEVEFFGDYAFTLDLNKTITGTPLAGRSVGIPHGTPFVFVKYDEYHNFYNPQVIGGVRVDSGWELSDSIQADVTLQGTEETVGRGQLVALQDNLPECTLVELLKAVAAMTGTALNYDDANGITFDTVDLASWPVWMGDECLIGVSNIQRTFGDWAQHNLVEFDSGEKVLEMGRIIDDYAINNVNIESENTLQTIPFSEGGVSAPYNGKQILLIRDEVGKGVLADCALAPDQMLRVDLQKNSGIVALCEKSTKVTASFRMSFDEYNAIKSHTLVQAQGVRYVWTSAQWQKGVAKFELSAI